MTNRKDNDQFPGTLGSAAECLLALRWKHANPKFPARCQLRDLPSGSSQPKEEDGKEQIPASRDGTVMEQSPGVARSWEIWLLVQTEEGKGTGTQGGEVKRSEGCSRQREQHV